MSLVGEPCWPTAMEREIFAIMKAKRRVYGVVGTQRSGSNFLCQALRGIPGLGDPKEYFSPVHIQDSKGLELVTSDLHRFVELVFREHEEGGSDFFGFKIHYLQYMNNFINNGHSIFSIFPEIQVIFLRRMNMVAQAVSLWRAELTQSWTHDLEPVRRAHYDFYEIRKRYFDLKIQDIMWLDELTKSNHPFLVVFYEDLVNDFQKWIFIILCSLGVGDRASLVTRPSIKKQGDERSKEWEARFREEYRETGEDENVNEWNERLKIWHAVNVPSSPNIWRAYG